MRGVAGLRERKKERTRRRIEQAALELFAARGYDAVTVNEIAAAADVAKATLFTYFPTKESLVLEGVGDDDLAGVVAGRAAGQSPLDALRAYCRALATRPGPESVDVAALVERIKVIAGSPALRAGAGGRQDRHRRALAEALAAVYPETEAALMAAQITASVLTLQETFFGRLASGMPLDAAAQALATDVELAFDLLEHGLGRRGAS